MAAHRLRSLCAVAAAALFGVGCMDVEYVVEVHDDGSGRMTLQALLDVERLAGFAQALGDTTGQSAEELCTEVLADAGPNADEAAEMARMDIEWDLLRDGDRCGISVTFDWEDPESFADRLAFLADDEEPTDGLAAPTGAIERVDDGWRFDLMFQPGPTEDELDEDVALLAGFGGIGVSVSVSMPGKVTDHNGTADGNTVNWAWDLLDPAFASGSRQLYAVSTPTAANDRIVPAIVAGSVVAVLGIMLLAKRSRRRRAVPHGRSSVPTQVDWNPTENWSSGQLAPPGPVFDQVHHLPPPDSSVPAGWYNDPQHPGRIRWWDGSRWTNHTVE